MVDGHEMVTTGPRWFTDNAWTERRAVCFMDSDDRHWTVEETDWPWTSKDASAEASNALVLLVRDAADLHQARDYIRSFAAGVPDGVSVVQIVKELTDIICWGIVPSEA